MFLLTTSCLHEAFWRSKPSKGWNRGLVYGWYCWSKTPNSAKTLTESLLLDPLWCQYHFTKLKISIEHKIISHLHTISTNAIGLTYCFLGTFLLLQKYLKIYLAPFLHGTRYTSFGRHFTKMDKLREVSSRIHICNNWFFIVSFLAVACLLHYLVYWLSIFEAYFDQYHKFSFNFKFILDFWLNFIPKRSYFNYCM